MKRKLFLFACCALFLVFSFLVSWLSHAELCEKTDTVFLKETTTTKEEKKETERANDTQEDVIINEDPLILEKGSDKITEEEEEEEDAVFEDVSVDTSSKSKKESSTKEDLTLADKHTSLNEEDVVILARIIFSEAGSEPYKGKVAVGAVVLNRVENSSFPSTIKSVIFQKGQFCGAGNSAFNRSLCSESVKAAEEALSGEDPVDGALYFLNKNIAGSPSWLNNRKFVARIGDHWFYR